MGFLNKFRPRGKEKNFQDEVLEHLYDLLSTKRLFGAMQRDYGLGDFTDSEKIAFSYCAND